MNRETLLNRTCLNCADFARQLACYSALEKYKDKLNQNFWIYVYNNSIDMAVLDWFHIFGNDKDDIHWKNIEADHDKFRNELFTFLNTNKDEWIKYRGKIKAHRNKDVAHIEVKPKYDIPEMDIALKAICFYYDRVVSELKNNNKYQRYPSSLEDYYDRLLKQMNRFVDTAFKATEGLNEEVY